MTQRTQPPRLMLMDACVLIDFIKTEQAVLELIVNHVGPLYVTSPVIDEVNEIEDENELVALGLIIIEPEIEDAYTAADRSGPLSFEDWLCLLTAKRHGSTCVTNDMNLRKLCNQEGVSLLWGLELLSVLHKVGGLPAAQAEAIAQDIQRSNPRHITDRENRLLVKASNRPSNDRIQGTLPIELFYGFRTLFDARRSTNSWPGDPNGASDLTYLP